MMKQKLFFAVFGLCLGCASQEKTAAPDWYLDREGSYPASLYVAAAGEGDTRAEAETAAVAGAAKPTDKPVVELVRKGGGRRA
jgi:hypothetical protein